jgi:uncharacterized membrane protein
MITLIVLAGAFTLVLFFQKFVLKKIDTCVAGRIAMSSMLLFTAIGHFIYLEGMTMMLPDFIPFRKEVVIVTGVLEILAAIGLLIPRLKKLTSILLIIFFVALLPANIYAALNHVNFQTADLTGNGATYLWFRVPLQVLFIWWVWNFGYLDTQNKNKERILEKSALQ